jgi:hypothetical protein
MQHIVQYLMYKLVSQYRNITHYVYMLEIVQSNKVGNRRYAAARNCHCHLLLLPIVVDNLAKRTM